MPWNQGLAHYTGIECIKMIRIIWYTIVQKISGIMSNTIYIGRATLGYVFKGYILKMYTWDDGSADIKI